jgi:hypothetical protein
MHFGQRGKVYPPSPDLGTHEAAMPSGWIIKQSHPGVGVAPSLHERFSGIAVADLPSNSGKFVLQIPAIKTKMYNF